MTISLEIEYECFPMPLPLLDDELQPTIQVDPVSWSIVSLYCNYPRVYDPNELEAVRQRLQQEPDWEDRLRGWCLEDHASRAIA